MRSLKLFQIALIPLAIGGCASIDADEQEDAIDAQLPVDDDKADTATWSGAQLAGAVRAANSLTLAELDNDVGLTTRAAKAIVAARPLRGIAALDAVAYIGPVAIGRLATYADERGWATVTMQKVPRGTFMMGHPNGFRFEPLHEVKLSTYWIDRTEVTNAQWAECVADGGCAPQPAAMPTDPGYAALPDHPVRGAMWLYAYEFCRWAGKRLPSEAQWEKAARGTTDVRVHPWGDDAVTCDRALVNSCTNPTRRPLAVGSRPLGASVFGVEDMNGNVSEWVSDFYNEFEPVCAEPCVDPEGIPQSAADNGYHGVRGASFESRPGIAGLQIHERWGHYWRTDIGFRCALQ